MNTTTEFSESNLVYLVGTVAEAPVFAHEVMGEGFYELKLAVQRLSDSTDILPVTISERLMTGRDMHVGTQLSLEGQFRSYNKPDGGRSRLMLTVFVRELIDADTGRNPNTIELTGYLCKPPVYRTTPFKREISDLLLAVNRAYNKSDYIPCICWGRNARYAKDLRVGARVTVSGRIQSREYQKRTEDGGAVTKTAFEVSVSKVSGEPLDDAMREAAAVIAKENG
ncbi:MAG: single-stranded DNA-binding protein [Clostridiales bacterium]|jgi:primosomal replication protein N|nr:single-stranded DNA-binding protein [Clostridiales bacterium]